MIFANFIISIDKVLTRFVMTIVLGSFSLQNSLKTRVFVSIYQKSFGNLRFTSGELLMPCRRSERGTFVNLFQKVHGGNY